MTARPSRRHRGLVLVLLALIALATFPFVSTAIHVAAADQITVNIDEANSDFPNGVTFKLDAEGQRKISRIELLYRTADSETLNLEVPDFKPAKNIDLTHPLDLRINFEPAGIDITYHWRLIDDRGNALETEPKTLLWFDNRFDWQSVSSADVTVYAYNQNTAFSNIILESAQRTVDRLKVEYDVDPVKPIRIWVYNSGRDYAKTQPINGIEWSGGSAPIGLDLIHAVVGEGNKREVARIIPHEVSHQMLYQATENPFNNPPLWFDEGLAVLNQEVGKDDFAAVVRDAAAKGRLFSVRALSSNFPYDAADAHLAYAESHEIIRFIIAQFGEDKLRAIILAFREGVSHDDALRMGIGIDTDELDRRWKASLNYPGDQPRATGTTRDSSDWSDFVGIGLASGTLVLVIALLVVGLFRLSTHRRPRQRPAHLG
ncbi:MAG: hypothetical protein QOJ59_1979 [Thermomicrobiales bacterium]|jgi:hypothetical protein|nr:hypothetical protein [Thermomicrobiales bacterium]